MFHFILSSYYLHHLCSKENGIKLSCVDRYLKVYFEISRPLTGECEVACKDGRAFNSIDSLQHCCYVAYVSLFFWYYNGFYASEIRELIPKNHASVGEHIRMWLIGQWSAYLITDKIHSLV